MLSLLFAVHAISISDGKACAERHSPCSPPGALNSIVPPVGDALSGLYFDLTSSVHTQPVIRDIAADHVVDHIQQSTSTLCCAQGTECRLLQSYKLAFCWDQSTANYFLPDGSYGNIFTGYYNSSSGVLVNLVSGGIALPNGQTGNVYSATPQAKPVTSLLAVPSPWSSRGLGMAISTTELGVESMYQITAAEPTLAPTNSISFPSMTSAGGPTQTRYLGNITGFLGLPVASTGMPCGCGTRPAANTSRITTFSGGAASHHIRGTQMVQGAVLLALLVQFVHGSCLI